jgi:AraC-like DNA-binding protein
VSPHDHDYYEIFVVRSGSGIHCTEFYNQPMNAGTVVVVPPARVHAMRKVNGLQVTNIYYLAEWLLTDLRALWDSDGLVPLFLSASLFRKPEYLRVPQFVLPSAALKICQRELRDVDAELAQSNPSATFLKAVFVKFLILLSRAYAEKESLETQFPFRREIWMALHQVEDCITNSRPLQLEALAGEVHLSTDHLTRLFKSATGWAPLEYYQRRRVHHACRLLLDVENSVTSVGYKLAYADTAHLSRMFKRYAGLTPRAYRQMYSKSIE